MFIASSYPFWGVFWTILIVGAWVLYIWIAIMILIDVFRRDDLSGWGKAGWVIAVIVLEWIGALIYLIVWPSLRLPRALLVSLAANGASVFAGLLLGSV